MSVSANIQIVGIKNLKSSQTWRIEMDLLAFGDEATEKIKELIELLDKSCAMGLVENKEEF